MTNLREQIKNAYVNQDNKSSKIKHLMDDLKDGKIIVPEYQRNFVWEKLKQCKFIESIFINVPIPPIFFLEKYSPEKEEEIFEIIDGVQRFTTATIFCEPNFASNLFPEVSDESHKGLMLKGLETCKELNNCRFEDLPKDVQNQFLNRELNIVLIKADTSPEIQFEVFGRLNQGSVTLNAQELRNCMFHGVFNEFLKKECRQVKEYDRLLEAFPKFKQRTRIDQPDKARMLDIELILRFFSLYESYDLENKQYPETRSETFNNYMRKRVEIGLESSEECKEASELKNLLKQSCFLVSEVFVDNNLNRNHFRAFIVKKDKKEAKFISTLNQAVFDVQMLGFIGFERQDIEECRHLLYDAFLDLSSYDDDFIDSTTRSTNAKINQRITIWKSKVREVLENRKDYEEIYEKKKNLFNQENLTCSKSGFPIREWHELDLYKGKAYHRYSSPKLDKQRSTEPRDRSVRFILQSDEYKYEDIKDAIQFILLFLQDNIEQDDEHNIKRLLSLEFIGTREDLSRKSTEKLKEFKELGIKDFNTRKNLYFQSSGGRRKNIERLNELSSLFSFMSDFKILE